MNVRTVNSKRLILITAAVLAIAAVIIFAVSMSGKRDTVNASELGDVADAAYTESEDEIIENIAILGSCKAANNTAADEAKAAKNALLNLGAIPSEAELSEIRFSDPVKTGGKAIESAADLLSEYGSIFDIFGIKKTVTDGGVDYEVYELIIQRASGSDVLSMKLMQNGRLGVDYTLDKKPESLLLNEDGGSIGGGGAETSLGHSKSYSVIPFTTSTVSFLFVKGDDGAWYHTATYNFANLNEIHKWYYFENGESVTGNVTVDTVKYADGYENRAAYAVAAYKNDRALCVGLVTEIKLSEAKNPKPEEAQGKEFSIGVVAVETLKELTELK